MILDGKTSPHLFDEIIAWITGIFNFKSQDFGPLHCYAQLQCLLFVCL